MRFDVIKHHRWWFTLSSILVIASLVSIFVRGFNFGIDYTGGTIVEVMFDQPVQVAQVREDLKQFNLENAIIQLSGESNETSGKDVIIRTRNLDANESAAIVESLNKNVGHNEVKRVESVGAVIGSEVTEHALINLAIAFVVLAASNRFLFLSCYFP